MSVFIRYIDGKVMKLAASRTADICIGGTDDPYLRRWFVIPRNRFFNVYAHHICRSDDNRALHDHPWWNISILLKGSYTEHTIAAGGVFSQRVFSAGQIKCRFAKYAHRIELHGGPCWTLFITGPRLREWGFHCSAGWRHWKDFTAFNTKGDSTTTGPGCD